MRVYLDKNGLLGRCRIVFRLFFDARALSPSTGCQVVLRWSKGLKDLFINREIIVREWVVLQSSRGCLAPANCTYGSDPCYRGLKKYTLTLRSEMTYAPLSRSNSNGAAFTCLRPLRPLISNLLSCLLEGFTTPSHCFVFVSPEPAV